jgi:hypothetical protein
MNLVAVGLAGASSLTVAMAVTEVAIGVIETGVSVDFGGGGCGVAAPELVA